MRVNVLYFGVLKEFFEGERDVVELAEGADVAALLHQLRGGEAGETGVWGSLAVAVNREYAGVGTVLRDGDEVALLPPVSGGCGNDPGLRGETWGTQVHELPGVRGSLAVAVHREYAGVGDDPGLRGETWGTQVRGGGR